MCVCNFIYIVKKVNNICEQMETFSKGGNFKKIDEMLKIKNISTTKNSVHGLKSVWTQ